MSTEPGKLIGPKLSFQMNDSSICGTMVAAFVLDAMPENAAFQKGLGVRDDPVLHERDQAKEIFKETVEFEKDRYIVQLPIRKSYNELSYNYPLVIPTFPKFLEKIWS
ncbi:hypothetical protein TNCV_535201 [Trichonephila clavipes]|nr:hypothetical protein TNCV_535201 [Trichonephila clavipes]